MPVASITTAGLGLCFARGRAGRGFVALLKPRLPDVNFNSCPNILHRVRLDL